MIEIPLTKGKIAIVDDDMAHLLKWKFFLSDFGYARRTVCLGNGKRISVFLHHLVAGFPINKFQIDHINGDRLDNRRNNLRIVTRRQNQANRREHRGEKLKNSKFVGVTKAKNKWAARIKINGRNISLGSFELEKTAGKAYLKAIEILRLAGIQ